MDEKYNISIMNKKNKQSTNNSTEAAGLDRKVRRLSEGITTVHKTTRLLTGPMELKQVLEIVVKTIAEVLRVDAAGLRLLDEDSGQLVLKATWGLSEAYKSKGPVTAAEGELNERTLHGEPIIIEDMRTSPNFHQYRKDVVREGLISSLSIGLLYRDKGIGILRLYCKRERNFTQTDIYLAQTVAAQSAAAIVNARLYAESLKAERMERQMKLAGQVQRHLIPEKAPNIPGLDIACVYVPCYEVGGDFYDFITLPDGRLILALGDIMGKGVPASLAMASLRSSLRAYAEDCSSLAELVGRVNRMFCRDTDPGEFATMFCGSLNDKKDQITYCNCGHEPPILIHKNKSQITDLSEGGLVLGIDSKAPFETKQIPLRSGDILIMYTDGLADAVDFNRESFGRKRVMEAALASVDMTAEQTVKNMLWLMRKFAGLAKRFDDTAIVVLKKL